MDKVQAFCICVLVSSARAAAFGYLAKPEDSEFHDEDASEEDAFSGRHKDLLDVPKDILSPPKDILESPKDLLNDDLEDFAENGADSPKSSGEEPQDHPDSHDIISSFERQPGTSHKDPQVDHETSHDIIKSFDGNSGGPHEHPKAHHDTSHGIIASFEGRSPLKHPQQDHQDHQDQYEQVKYQGPPQTPQTTSKGMIRHYQREYQSRRKPEYAFNYGVYDPDTRDVKSAWELRDGDHTQGGYSLVEPDGYTRVVEYSVSKKGGFNALVKRLPPFASQR